MDNCGLTLDGVNDCQWDRGLYVQDGGVCKLVYLRLRRPDEGPFLKGVKWPFLKG